MPRFALTSISALGFALLASRASAASPTLLENPSSAPAEEIARVRMRPESFGGQGITVISGGTLTFGSGSFSHSEAEDSTYAVDLGADHFITDYVSLGGFASVRYDWRKGYSDARVVESKETTWGAGARIGANIPFGEFVSWWPKLSFSFGNANSSSTGNTREVVEHYTAVSLYAPLLIHPVQHFFVGFGPNLYYQLSHSVEDSPVEPRRSYLGTSMTVGGWF